MRKEIILIIILFLTKSLFADSPHGSNFNRSCSICHLSEQDRTLITKNFNHDATNFRLAGTHASVSCKKCHPTLVFSEQKNAGCLSCHPNPHKSSTENNCEDCHSTENWQSIQYNHSMTAFPLTGKHQTISCNECHKNNFSSISTECIDCHSTDYEQTTNPDHKKNGYPTSCEKCHDTQNWTTIKFNHSLYTRFQLTGLHSQLKCTDCHSNGFHNTSMACVSCHLNDMAHTKNPDHIRAGFSKECSLCHTTDTWKPSIFNHNSGTNFPLNGAHLKADCNQCHIINYANTSTECVSCHLKDYLAARNPDHVKANFSKDCQTCHTTSGRSPSKFNHNTATNFPLRGAHIGLDCKKCHQNTYKGRSTACFSCHSNDYYKVDYPNHDKGGFSKECQICHDEKSWKENKFNHTVNTSFPLTNGHNISDCKACHTTIFRGTSTTCISCHQKDYASMQAEGHEKQKYPVDCENCHTTKKFKGASFHHDSDHFPIFGQSHKNVWQTCYDCHINRSDFSEYSCTNCHEHSDQVKTDALHNKVKNYTYQPKSCLTCHPK